MTYNGHCLYGMFLMEMQSGMVTPTQRDYLWVGEDDLFERLKSCGASTRLKNTIEYGFNRGRDKKGLRHMTVAEARAMTDAEWMRVPNFGRVSLAELRTIIGSAI